MAKKTEVSAESVTQQIMNYLEDTNRPYSATDISLNLQLKKPITTKTLSDLAAKGKISQKENGKQCCYYVNQKDDEQSPEDIQTMLDQTKDLEENIVELKGTVQSNIQYINDVSKYPADSELSAAIVEMAERKEALQSKLDELRKQPMDPKEKDRINKSYTDVVKLWKSRKAKAKNILGELADKMEKSPSELVELIGLETDEDYDQSYEEMSKFL